MNVFAQVEVRVTEALQQLIAEGKLPDGLDFRGIEASAPREKAHGDVATNAAMVLAKRAKMKPRDIAELLAAKLQAAGDVAGVEVAGQGFINLTFEQTFWQALVGEILAQGDAFGRVDLGAGQDVNVEYVSANPTGPMHVGHCRGAVFGDALGNLLAFAGYKVTREYYINDAGSQVDVLARSAYLRYREALGEEIGEIPAGLYPGDYLEPVGEALAKTHGKSLLDKPESEWLGQVREDAIAAMMDLIRDDLGALNIHHDVFFSEASMGQGNRDEVAATIDEMRNKGLIYEGRLPKPKGHEDGEWEDREQTLFRSTDFGDDIDRALVKSDGSYTYFAADIAYHRNKLMRGFKHLINVFGADHIGYIKRMKAAVKALSGGEADLDIKVCQLVKLYRGGQPLKMSKRAGTFVTLRDVVDEVGRDPVRFMMLYRKNDAPLDFDFAKVVEQSKDNPVFYVQYAHARCCSVFTKAQEAFDGLGRGARDVIGADLSALSDDGEIELIKTLAAFPNIVAGAAKAHEPHRLAFYLYEVAQAFHQQYNRGTDSPHLRFIRSDDRSVTAARLGLVAAVSQVLSSGLTVLGVGAPVAMR